MLTTLPWPPPLWTPPDPDVPGRMRRLLARLRNPHHALPPIVHIAGSTGKSSTLAFLRAMLEAGGLRVHQLTGPHLFRYNERILLAGQEVSDSQLRGALERCRIAADGEAYTLPEGLTAAAMLLFAEIPADILLMESHVGGLLDATNVPEHIRLSLLGPISYGHTPQLGHELRSIAAHHLGILRAGVPCVSGLQVPEVRQELEAIASPLGVDCYHFGDAWHIRRGPEGVTYTDLRRDASWQLPFPAMQGDHQLLNAGVALTAANLLAEDFGLTPEHLAIGYQHASLPGRLEPLRQGKLFKCLPKSWELWFDAGSLPASLYALRQTAEREWRDAPLYLIFGASKRDQSLEDLSAGLQAFRHKAAMVQCVTLPDDPFAASAKEILRCVREAGLQGQEALSVEQALANLRRIAGDEPIRILLCGSLKFAPMLR